MWSSQNDGGSSLDLSVGGKEEERVLVHMLHGTIVCDTVSMLPR